MDIPFIFRKNIEYVLEDIQKFKVHRNIKKSAFDAFFTSSFRVGLILLNEGKPQESVQLLIDSYPLVNHFLGPMPLVYYLNEAAMLIQDSRLSLLLLKELVSMSDQYEDFRCFLENLACVYHAVAYTYPSESTEKREHLDMANKLMREEMDKKGLNYNTCQVMYGIILMSQEKLEAATEIFKAFVNSEENNESDRIQDDMLAFGNSEKVAVDEDLQLEISTHWKIEGPAILFAYYFLVKCLVRQDDMTIFPYMFKEYERVCEVYGKAEGFKLLGYSYLQVGQKIKAKGAFATALGMCPDDKLLQKNIAKCWNV